MNADDWLEAARIVVDNAKRDPVNNAVLPLIGAVGIFAVWHYGFVSWPTIKAFFCYDLC